MWGGEGHAGSLGGVRPRCGGVGVLRGHEAQVWGGEGHAGSLGGSVVELEARGLG